VAFLLRGVIMTNFARALQTFLFGCRWLLAPFYICLVASLVALLFKLAQHALHMVTHLVESTESSVTLDILSLIDMTLVGSLIVLVVFSGYENFVSPVDSAQPKSWPDWMGDIDFTGLKLKLMSSIVAISAIQVLRDFMDLHNKSDRDLAWGVGIHLSFVVSALILALSDRYSSHAPGKEHSSEH
jgi:uncharacterized protein (TIGR00645 family)